MPMHCIGTYTTGRVRARAVVAAAVSALVLAATGCGERHTTSPGAPGATTTAAGSKPAITLAKAPKRPGEIVVTANGSPQAHGPYAFDGRYRVRFEQVDPEDPAQTFTGQTTFVAVAAPDADQDTGRGVVPLVRGAKRSDSATVELHGRLYVNVSFGDFPYAVRLTPVAK